MNKSTWIILSIILVLFGGLTWYLISSKQPEVLPEDTDIFNIIPALEENGFIADHVRGNPEAEVILFEYGDYQCPGCASTSARINAIVDEYGDQVALVFRNFPIPSIHPNAKAAAAAAEAAGLQDKFWEMHETLFTQRSLWINSSIDERTSIFINFAELLGIDRPTFEEQIKSEAINKKINFDLAIAKEKNVTGTPTLFINHDMVSPSLLSDDTKLKELIDQALEK